MGICDDAPSDVVKFYLKQRDKFIVLPQVIGFKARKQRKYDRIQVTAE